MHGGAFRTFFFGGGGGRHTSGEEVVHGRCTEVGRVPVSMQARMIHYCSILSFLPGFAGGGYGRGDLGVPPVYDVVWQ